MSWLKAEPTMEISASSGVLRVTLHPARSWLLALFDCGLILFFAAMIYRGWAHASPFLRGLFIFVILSTASALIFQFSGTEIIEISSQTLTLIKEIHGWDRRREFSLSECRELEWMAGGHRVSSRLQCKAGWRTIRFAQLLSGDQAAEIFKTLQQTLPDVAQQLCAYPASKSHFVTLDLR